MLLAHRGALAEVSPAPDVQGHDPPGAEQLGRSGGIRAGQSQRGAIEQGRAGGAGEQQRHINRPDPLGDIANDVQGGVVTADIDRGQSGAAHDESGDVAGQRFATFRTVPGWHGSDFQSAALGPIKGDGVPTGKTAGSAAQAQRGGFGRQRQR